MLLGRQAESFLTLLLKRPALGVSTTLAVLSALCILIRRCSQRHLPPPAAPITEVGTITKIAAPPSALCIHFDVNETIMLGDPAGGDSIEESFHKILAKVAYVRSAPEGAEVNALYGAYVWHDGSMPSEIELNARQREHHGPPLTAHAR